MPLYLVGNFYSYVTGALENAIRPALGAGLDALERHALVDKNGCDLELVHIRAFVVLSVGNGRLQNLLHQGGGLLGAEGQNVQRLFHSLATNLVSNQTGFLGRYPRSA